MGRVQALLREVVFGFFIKLVLIDQRVLYQTLDDKIFGIPLDGWKTEHNIYL